MDCKKCARADGCEIYCQKKKIKSLIKLIKDAPETEIGIGDTREESHGARGMDCFVVTGVQIIGGQEPVYSLVRASKYKGVIDEPKIEINELLDGVDGISEDGIKELRQMINKFNSYKVVIVPFKTSSVIRVIEDGEDGNQETCIGRLRSYEYALDTETMRIHGNVIVECSATKVKRFKFSEYGQKWQMVKNEEGLIDSSIDYRAIQMTRDGLIRPISIQCGEVDIIIDNCYLHWLKGGFSTVIGNWTKEGIAINTKILANVLSSENQKRWESIRSKIDKLKPFIMRHRELIVPFGLCDGVSKIVVRG